jgi:hypothetical protein
MNSVTITKLYDISEEERRCQQTNCNYYINGGCKKCKECGSKPYVINKKCDACYKCENIPDNVRFEEVNQNGN